MKYNRVYWLNKVREQQKWIENCENNGRSYTGINGPMIRQADNAELARLEAKLKECRS